MIKKAAVFKNGKYFTGPDHSVCKRNCIAALEVEPFETDYGFITDTGEFLSRTMAATHAWKCGQVNQLWEKLYSHQLPDGYSIE